MPGTHPDADAFLRHILAQPTDTTARLVFADWLDETDVPHNAAWARFIRLRIKADCYPPDTGDRSAITREADAHVPQIEARLTVHAKLFVGYPKSLLQLLPAPNILVKLADYEVPRAVIEYMPESVARENLVLPLDMQERTLLLAALDPNDHDLTQKLEFILNRDIVLVGVERDDVQAAIDRKYGPSETELVDSILVDFTNPPLFLSTDLSFEPTRDCEAIIRIVNLMIQEAINLRADRILITPELDSIAVRYRITGEWTERDRLPSRYLAPVTERIALMAVRLPLEWIFSKSRESPLSGVIPMRVQGLHFRLRVTIQPSPDGPTTQIDLVRDTLPIEL